jgi:hypothetical protein
MLDFMRETGDRTAFPYAYLIGVFWDKSGKLTFEFTGWKVEVEGQCLEKLYADVLLAKVEWIAEQGSRYVTPTASEPFVEKITLTAKGG